MATITDLDITAPDQCLTLTQVCRLLQVTRQTFRRWQIQGTGPKVITLPGGGIRILKRDLDAWRKSRVG